MLRRLAVARCVTYGPARTVSMKETIKKHGIPATLFYWVTNEILVVIITCLLHFGYFGKEDLVGFLEKLGASKYVNLDAVEHKSWSFFDGRIVISARLIANFAAASFFMSLLTPVQLPVSLALYPMFRRMTSRLNMFGGKRKAAQKL